MAINRFLWAVAALCISAPGLAQEEETEDTGPWSGEISAGYIASEGNTETSSGNAAVKIGYAVGAWENLIEGSAFGSSDDEGTTAEQYQALGRTQYNLDEKNYVFGQLEWRKNRFSAYTQQTFETVGYGRRVLDDDTFKLNFEVGAGLTQQKKVVEVGPAVPPATEPETTTENERGAVYTAAGNFEWQISETAKFSQYAGANVSSDNTYWETVTKVSVSIIDSLALAVGYTIQGNTDVDAGTEKTDRFTTINLDYSF